MPEKGKPPADDFKPLSEFERNIRERILSQDLADLPKEFIPHIVKSLEMKPPKIVAADLSGLSGAINDYLPWLIDIPVFPTAISTTGFDTLELNANAVYNFFKVSSGTQNDLIGWDIMLPAGTWTFELMHTQSTDRGIYTVTLTASGGLSEVSIGTIDGYAAAATYNVRSSLSVPFQSAPAKRRLQLKMATKNASSSAYKGAIQSAQLRRTA